eukprot:6147139-Pyramimonas_sp.AAC.1
MKHRGAFEPCEESVCRQATRRPPLRTRWVDANMGDEQRAKHRSRLVATRLTAAKRPSEQTSASELFSGAPPLEAAKLFCSLMVALGRSKRGRPLKIGFWDGLACAARRRGACSRGCPKRK